MRTTKEIFAEKFQMAIVDLIECYLDETPFVTTTSIYDDRLNVSAIVGLCDDQFRASIVLIANSEMVVEQFGVTEACAPDWLGELCNQLVGRLKNKVAVFGLQPMLSTPTTLVGKVLKVSSRATDACVCQITWSHGGFVAQMSLEFDEELRLTENKELSSMAEGSLELF